MDTKQCRRCDRALGLQMFRVKRHKYPDGRVHAYHHATCVDCMAKIDADRYERRKRGETAPPGRPAGSRDFGRSAVALYVRPANERDCDAAFMGWRAVEGVSFQGARL